MGRLYATGPNISAVWKGKLASHNKEGLSLVWRNGVVSFQSEYKSTRMNYLCQKPPLN